MCRINCSGGCIDCCPEDHLEEDEVCVGDWALEFEKDERVRQRIACDERGYPHCEARYSDVKDWEESTGKSWAAYIASIL